MDKLTLRIQIAGCGYIGRALAAQMVAAGHEVGAWSQRGHWAPSPQEGLPEHAPCRLEGVDLTQKPAKSEQSTLKHADALLLSCAAGRSVEACTRESIYLGIPNQLLPELRPGARVVALSSTSALPDLDCALDESCTLWPTHERGILARRAEDNLWSLAHKHGLDLVILRLAGLYGPGRPLERLYGRVQPSARPGDGHVATNLVHRDDVVQAITLALALPSPVHRLVHVCGLDHPSRRSMIAWAHRQQGLPTPTWEKSPPSGPLRGKRVCSARYQTPQEFGGLGGKLRHPHHAPAPSD